MKYASIGLVMFLGGMGCGVEATEPLPIEETSAPTEAARPAPATLLARVERDNGNVVEFYETAPGQLMVGEGGRYPNTPAQIGDLTPVEAWRTLTGRQDAPEALLAAQQRAELARDALPSNPLVIDAPISSTASDSVVPSAGQVNAMAGPCDVSWFNSTFCSGSYDWKMCLLDWWNGAYAQRSSTDYHRTAVCAISGSVVLDIDGQVIQSVPQGAYYWYWRSGSNFFYRSDVNNASGDNFHFFVGLNY